MEIYYYDIKMELNGSGNSEDLRIYLSDDDFSAEGSLGHHQGDVQMLAGADSNYGVTASEYGFVQAGLEWIDNNLTASRDNPSTIRGASTDDTENRSCPRAYTATMISGIRMLSCRELIRTFL